MAVDAPSKIAAQISEGIEQYRKPLRDARSRNATEGDTGLLVHRMLADVFGYDPFNEITSEFKIKGQFADFAVRIGGKVLLIVEVKAIGLKLNDQHLFQAASYAAREGVEWLILTNAAQWELYRVEFTQPVNVFRVLSIDLLEGSPQLGELVQMHKWGMQKGVAEAQWQKQSALSAPNLVMALLDPETLRQMSVLIRRATNMRVEPMELRERLIRVPTYLAQ